MASQWAFKGGLDLLFPPTCPICNAPVSAAKKLCKTCWDDLHFLSEPGCEYCGAEIEGGFAKICEACYENIRPWQSGRCCVAYAGTGRTMVLRLKNMRAEALAESMALLAFHHCLDVFEEVDFLLPVPLHWRKKLIRGFNQAALLAQHLGRLTQIQTLENALIRTHATEAQTRQGGFEGRFENLSAAFALKEPERLKGKNILLIDDVMTSGASFQNCCECLLEAQPGRVSVFAFARAG